MAKRDSSTPEESMKIIGKRDKENFSLYKKLYRIEFGKDLSPFHLVVGTDGIPARRLQRRSSTTSQRLALDRREAGRSLAEERPTQEHGYRADEAAHQGLPELRPHPPRQDPRTDEPRGGRMGAQAPRGRQRRAQRDARPRRLGASPDRPGQGHEGSFSASALPEGVHGR